MIHKTTITADTTSAENVSSEVEIHIEENYIIDLIFSNDSLDSDDKLFFAWEAMDELGIRAENSPKEFV